MFDIGWTEMGFVFLVALIIIGPKDLPRVARSIGQWAGKARRMARDFQRSLEDMAKETELDQIQKDVKKVTSAAGSGGLAKTIEKEIDSDGTLASAFKAGDPASNPHFRIPNGPPSAKKDADEAQTAETTATPTETEPASKEVSGSSSSSS